VKPCELNDRNYTDSIPNSWHSPFTSFLRKQTLRGFHSHPKATISLQPFFFPVLEIERNVIELKPLMKTTVAAKRNSVRSEMECWRKCKRRRNPIHAEGYLDYLLRIVFNLLNR